MTAKPRDVVMSAGVLGGRLAELTAMHDQGKLTDEQYEAATAAIKKLIPAMTPDPEPELPVSSELAATPTSTAPNITVDNVHTFDAFDLKNEIQRRGLPMPAEGNVNQPSLMKVMMTALVADQKRQEEENFRKMEEGSEMLQEKLACEKEARKADAVERSRVRREEKAAAAAAEEKTSGIAQSPEEQKAAETDPVPQLEA